MKKLIDIDDEDFSFLVDLKKNKGTSIEAFIRLAIQEKIFQTKQEIKLIENGTLHR
jgi:hypothetical protein